MSPTEIVIVAVAFLLTLSIVVSTLRIGISPMPSSARARRAMLAAAEGTPDGTVIDLGSGWGTLAIAFARRHPGRTVVGYELSWVPWAVSVALKHLLGLRHLSFRREDFRRAAWPPASVVLCYLFPRGMHDLAQLIETPGGPRPSLLVSNTFALPSVPADEVITLDDVYRTRVYVYRWAPHPPA
jgi:hypothetical protein